jgi:hypothetical protein
MAEFQRWEYVLVDALTNNNGSLEAQLNALGAVGWEAVGWAAVGDERGARPEAPVMVLKRPVP